MVSAAATVAGVVAVQSGVPGTATLPILPHRAVAPAATAGGAELPAPAEVSADVSAPPGAGVVRQAPAARAAVVPERQPAADRPTKGPRHAGDTSGKGDRQDRSGKGPGSGSGKDSGKDSHGGDGQS